MKRSVFFAFGLIFFAALLSKAAETDVAFDPRRTLYIEAESFSDGGARSGGWTLDPQLIDTVGSSVLLAHGLGKPVADAVKTVVFPQSGEYRVWVRTRNWVAPWTEEYAPGRFALLIDGAPLPVEFGTSGAEWHWHDGGRVRVDSGERTVALHDLTGFDGRCDALIFTLDDTFVPPNDKAALAALRRQSLGESETVETTEGPFDLVVVGGGMAGLCAAVGAARLGLNTALIQDRFTLGGNNSSDVRVHLQGRIHLPPYPNLGNLVYELQPDLEGNAQVASNYEDQKKFDVARAEKNLRLFMATHVEGVEKAGDSIAAVTARHIVTNRRTRFVGRLFADCTGDGNLGFLAGADWRYGRESQVETGEPSAPPEADSMTMGASVQWYSVETDEPTEFPEQPWAVQFSAESARPDLRGDWDWETGLNWNQIDEIEKIRDNGLRAAYGHWSYMKNHADGEWSERTHRRELGWVASYAGKRESRRLLGDVVVDEVDVRGQRVWPDATVTTTWDIDLHYPEKSNERFFGADAFRTYCVQDRIHPYAIPYRCFYSRNVENLFMAGRDISVTHAALGTIRVMRTGGMMGETVGMAASLCKALDTSPRGVYENHLDELKALMEKGVGAPVPGTDALFKPDWLDGRTNLALKANVSASSEHESGLYPASNVNDGKITYPADEGRYVSQKGRLHTVRFDFDSPVTLSAMRFVVGPVGPERLRYWLEYEKDGAWVPVPGSSIKNRHALDFSIQFDPVTARSFRFVQRIEYGDDLLRLWEVELY